MIYYLIAVDNNFVFNYFHCSCYWLKRIVSMIDASRSFDHLNHRHNYVDNLVITKYNLSVRIDNSSWLFRILFAFHLIFVFYQNYLLNLIPNTYSKYFYFQVNYFAKIIIFLYSFSLSNTFAHYDFN